ncbi:MAG: hypothetical protein R3B45_16335 [Bdellovibrionota bacterium]
MVNKNTFANKAETLILGWLDPRTNTIHHAGVGFYNEQYGEYLLKIDEEPSEKKYYLKPSDSEDNEIRYRMELVLKRKDGSFLKRQLVGEGYKSDDTNGNVFIDYGSKYKTLVLYLNN